MSEVKTSDKTARKRWVVISVNALLILCIAGALAWAITTYFDLNNEVYTNDAQVEEYINPVNTRIPGYIRDVRFQEHQPVKKGDTLVTIDDREYKIQLEQAEAALLSADAARKVASYTINTVHSNLSTSDANISAARARLWNAKQNYSRYANLLKEGAATQQQFDQVKSEFDALSDQTNALIEQRHTTLLSTDETTKRTDVNDAEIKRAQASVDMARLNLSYTVVTAPYNGVTGRRVIQEGQLLQAGQTMLSFVRNDSKWVIANYMETEISKLHVGQKVLLKVDGFDQKELLGKIVSISEATGSRYSAIPLDNSTGNFIKVRQRIPVRIEFLHTAQGDAAVRQLRAGMNVEVRLSRP